MRKESNTLRDDSIVPPYPNVGTKRGARGLGSKQKSRKKWVLLTIALCMLMSGLIASVVGYLAFSGMYHRDMALAQAGSNSPMAKPAPSPLPWLVPHAAKNDANGWHYHSLIQLQAGAIRMLHLQITLPPCAVLSSTGGVSLSRKGQGEMLIQPLNEDLNVTVDYTCR
jgi:hypothetical protein